MTFNPPSSCPKRGLPACLIYARSRLTALTAPTVEAPITKTVNPNPKPSLANPRPHPSPHQAAGLVDKLKEAIDGPDADAREAALLAITQLPASAGRAAEPYLLPLVPLLLEKLADKAGPVRDAASAASLAVAHSLCPHAAEMVIPTLFAHTDASKKWQVREGALQMLAAVAEVAPRQVAVCLPEIVPLIATLMVDPREQVRGGRGIERVGGRG